MKIMKDILNPSDKVHKLKWGGKCEFNEHPEGVIVKGQVLEPQPKVATKRPESLKCF